MALQLVSGLAVSALINTTVYRVTPKNYTGILTNMNSGDINGDCTFGLMELTFPFWCPENPNWLNCRNVPILNIPGFNVYEEHVIEQDSRFGDYGMCNPNPDTGVFSCVSHSEQCWYNNPYYSQSFADVCDRSQCICPAVENASVGREFCPLCDIPLKLIPDCPKQCSTYLTNVDAAASDLYIPKQTLHDVDLSDCCSAADEIDSFKMKGWSYDNNTRVCKVFVDEFKQVPSNGSFTGMLWKGGLNGTAQYFLGSTRAVSSKLNGTWYSTVENGECKEGQKIGVDCWWRKLETKRTVNATCVAQNIVRGVYEKRPICWNQNCQPGWKLTDECSINCVFNTILGKTNSSAGPMERDEICRGFNLSFASSDPEKLGCPEDPVHVPSL
eukprot:TRINITY_DN22760_c0_g1_i1.p1 TRINITY_DN22760_c0_g1~~TRINITY_DN22760_c0_g1_i1.p1  ORF type:complete len:398 (+),score=79.49 TRINITY_DN22760_c0_g1_i1:42-1196(+)